MYDVQQEHWVISEERENGETWPLIVVAESSEAVQLVSDLRARGRRVDAVQINAAAAEDLCGVGRPRPT